MYKKLIIVTTIVAVGVAILILGQPHNYSKTIKIGVIAPLSGETASLGQKIRNGIELARTDTHAGEHIQFIYEDGDITPKTALTAYRKLTSVDKVDYIIGPFGPDQIMPIAPLLKSSDVLIGITLCDERFLKYPPVFCTYPSIPDQTRSGIRSVKTAGVQKLGLITQTGELGDTIENELIKGQADGDYTLVRSDRLKPGDKDFRTIITKLKASGVNGIYTATLPDEGYILLKQLRDLGFSGRVFSVFDATEEKLRAMDTAAEGVYFPGHISPQFEPNFVSEYTNTYGDTPDMYGAIGHSIASTLIEALIENNFQKDELAKKLVGRNEKTAIDGFTFRTDHTVSVPVESLIFLNGKLNETGTLK